MSSWLKFNESLNSLKGQISTFANNVLAEDEGEPRDLPIDYEALKQICLQQEQEIQKLRKAQLDGAENNVSQKYNGSDGGSSWDWEECENPTEANQDDISHLKNQIKELEIEKNELVNQLEQLDIENQQNLDELMKTKEKIQEENNEIKNKFKILKKQNLSLVKEEEKLKLQLQEIQKESHLCAPSEGNADKYEILLKNHQKLQAELEETKKQLAVMRSTQATLEKTLQDTKSTSEKELQAIFNQLKNVETEKKIIYGELQKAQEFVKSSEIKSREDTENCEKLALILDTYEKQVSVLKSELEVAQKNNTNSKSNSKKIENLEKSNKKLQEELETTLEMVKLLEMENQKVKHDLFEVTNKEQLESKELKNLLQEKTKELRFLQEKFDQTAINPNDKFTDILSEEALHKVYVSILSQNLQKYFGTEISHESLEIPSVPFISEFTEQVEKIFTVLYDLKIKCETLEKQNLDMSQEILKNNELKRLFEENSKEIRHLQEKLAQVPTIQEDNLSGENLHKIYVSIIKTKFKIYADSETPLESLEIPSQPYITEFSNYVESIFGIISDLKTKCEALEKQNAELSQEKTRILTDKNIEIEKLLQNSENLSQDVLRKNDEIKVLEDECEEQRLNNSELEAELREYQNSKLDTISETNEDNVVLLESQLEIANKRIKNLEILVNKRERSPEVLNIPTIEICDTDNNLENKTIEENSSLEEGQVQKTEQDYRELLKMFDDLKIDYDLAQKELNNTKIDLDLSDKENEELRSELDKLKNDFDNSLDNADYQLAEANITLDTLKEEISSSKAEIDKMLEENKTLSLLKNEVEKSIVDTKTELNDTREMLLNEENKRRELETQVRALIEKLQNAKMSETSLKLQYDTLTKDYNILSEVKKNMELTYNNTKGSIEEYEKNYSETLEKYDAILLRCEDLNTKILERDNELVRANSQLTGLIEENDRLKQNLQDKEILVSDLEYQLQQANLAQNERLLEERQKSQNLLNTIQDLQSALENKSQKDQESFLQSQIVEEKQKIISDLELKIEELQKQLKEGDEKLKSQNIKLVHDINGETFKNVEQEKQIVDSGLANLKAELKQSNDNIVILQNKLQEISNSKKELIAMVTTKNQESLTYYNEIQRLTQMLQTETEKGLKLELEINQNQNFIKDIEKLTDQNNFLKEKCDVLAKNLLEEQAKYQKLVDEKTAPSEKEANLNKQLERLQTHLMEVEEHYTQELLQAEQQNSELRTKMDELERREKDSSTMYTSVSIRANQQVESLQSQLQMVTSQRDELRKKISDAEDQSSKQSAALANLQFVLEQFQRDKEKDIHQETERIRRQINAEKKIQEDLKAKMASLTTQLEESKQGLLAASRLSDQLEYTKTQNVTLREEVTQLQEKLSKSEKAIYKLTNQTDGKVEKSLVKSLVVGFLSSGNSNAWNKDQIQILKIISTILDFNQQDHEKVKLNQTQGSWLGSFIFGGKSGQPNMSQESLSQAFIKFLETESKPRVVPSLLESSNVPTDSQKSSISGESTTSSRKSSRASPIVLSEIVLPTFDDFGRSRNSSSILKDVLKDNSNS